MTNSANDIQYSTEVWNSDKLNYLGAIASDEDSKQTVLSMIAQTTASLTKLKPVWRDNTISFGLKMKLTHHLFISIFLYACEP